MARKRNAWHTRSPVLQILQRAHKLVFLVDRDARPLIEVSHGISFSQFHILMTLYVHQTCHQHSIADFLGTTDAAISRQVEMLQKKRLVRRRVDMRNRRRYNIALTKKGAEKVVSTLKDLEKHFSYLSKVLAASKQKTVANALSALIEVIPDNTDFPNRTRS